MEADAIETRARRMLWAITDGHVAGSEGWACAPTNSGYWWFPRLGYSLFLGTTCFERRDEAVTAARAWIAKRRQDLDRLEASL